MVLVGTWFFIAGAAMGSFFNVLIVRLPKGQNIVAARSMCPNCKTQLKWYDLIPIFSFLFLKGKCRYCGYKLSYQYLLSEIAVGGLFLLAFLVQGQLFSYCLTIFYLSLWSMLFVVGMMDYREGIIIDQVMLPFVLVAAVDRLACGTHIKELLFGAAAGFGLYFLVYLLARLFYKKEGFGMGDVVLLTAIGFFFSPAKTILVGILAFYCCFCCGFSKADWSGVQKYHLPHLFVYQRLLSLSQVMRYLHTCAISFTFQFFRHRRSIVWC